MFRFFLLLGTVLVSGCGIGGFWMNGNPSVGRNLKPYGTHWIKEGMTRDGRRTDSWSCGAANTIVAADHVIFATEKIDAERISSDQNDYGPRGRLFDRWGICMQSKGYVYLENCDARCLYP